MRTIVLLLSLTLALPSVGHTDERKRPISQLNQAVETIRKQVDWFGPQPKKYSRHFLMSVATMNLVQSRVSPLNYALLSKQKRTLPTNPEECLAQRAGICGNQVLTFIAIGKRLGLRTRTVEFYIRGKQPQQNHSHICVEVFFGGEWRLFDVTWGTYYRQPAGRVDDLLSWTQLQQSANARNLAVSNRSDLWWQQSVAAGIDPLEYIDAKMMDVLLGRGGTIHLTATTAPQPLYVPTHQPNYVGRNSDEPDRGTINFRLLHVTPDCKSLTINILGLAGSGQLRVRGKVGSVLVAFDNIQPGPLQVDLSQVRIDDSLELSVQPARPDGVGYVVFRNIGLQPAPAAP